MRRRIVWILVVVMVLGGVGLGTAYWIRRGMGRRPLARATLAMRARNYDRALKLTDQYLARHPEDWLGWHLKAEVLLDAGRYVEAREPLARAAELAPDEPQVALTLARSHRLAAAALLSRKAGSVDADTVSQAVAELQEANRILSEVTTQDADARVDVAVATGTNHQMMAGAWERQAAQLTREAEVAAVSRSPDKEAALGERARSARAQQEQHTRRAIEVLKAAVLADLSRADALGQLVGLCWEHDRQTLAVVGRAIRQAEATTQPSAGATPSVPPVAAMQLALNDLQQSGAAWNAQARKTRLTELQAQLERLGEDTEVAVARAEVSLMLAGCEPRAQDRQALYEKAVTLCDEVIQENPRQRSARLIKGRALLAAGRAADAEKVLFPLKTDYAHDTAAHLEYAAAAIQTGKTQLAREALRRVADMEPDRVGRRDVAEARRQLAEAMLKDGFADKALEDAREYYRLAPQQPAAVGLLTRAAIAAGQTDLVRQAAEEAAGDETAGPDLLMAAAEGFNRLGDRERAIEVARRAAACEAATFGARLAKAEALRRLGRLAEAERILRDLVADDPVRPALHLRLGALYEDSGRSFQARQQYRRAVSLAPEQPAYQLALGRVEYRIGNTETAREILERIESVEPAAAVLLLEIRLAQGEAIAPETALGVAGDAKSGPRLAVAYMAEGKLAECVEVCRAELAKASEPGEHRLIRSLLGHALLRLGQTDEATRQWSALVSGAPADPLGYERLAVGLGRVASPQDVRKTFAEISEAREELVELAMAQLHLRRGEPNLAVEACGRVIRASNVPAAIRDRVRLLRARVLAAMRRTDAALEDLDALAARPERAELVDRLRTEFLVIGGREEQAAAALDRRRRAAVSVRDDGALQWVAAMYARMNRPDDALAVCDELAVLVPDDVRTYLLQAEVLAGAGRIEQIPAVLEQVVRLQPGELGAWVRLVRTLNRLGRHPEALDALDRMADVGEVARLESLFQRGRLLAGWGLAAPALRRFEEVAATGLGDAPRVQVALAEALARLGQTDRARSLLASVPGHHVPARQLIAELADTDEQRLAALQKLAADVPGNVDVLSQRMVALARCDRHGDAVEAFKTFVTQHPGEAIPEPTARLAVLVALQADRANEALDWTVRFAAATRKLQLRNDWRQWAILIAVRTDARRGAALLPKTESASLPDALLGVALAVRAGARPEVARWHARVLEVARPREVDGLPVGSYRTCRLLAAVASQDDAAAADVLERSEGGGCVERAAARQLLSAAKADAAVRGHAAELLAAVLALDRGLAVVGLPATMQVLRARPTCQMAAWIALGRGDAAARQEVARRVRPDDSLIAQAAAAAVLKDQGRHAEAAAAYRRLAEAHDRDAVLLREAAVALDAADKPDEALALYRESLAALPEPATANNAAFLVARLHPTDASRLSDAWAWTQTAVEAFPDVPPFRDTRGWIAFLRGQTDQAAADARWAIKRMAASPEVHYHLGRIETRLGNQQLGRWHLEAAVAHAAARTARGEEITAAEAEAVRLARQALSTASTGPS